nr:zinc finger protein 845 [Danio rerio]|eukprot:XP_021329463.1 zinc finger protein 845 [Danio rerio]
MIHKCVIGGCPNRSDSIIHYMLPEDPRRRSLWMKFIEDSEAAVAVGSAGSSWRVCGDHFSEESFFTLNLGFSTCRILSVDAVPTVHPAARTAEKETPEAETESVENDTCSITISDTISLACVKDEPVEYELSTNATPGQEHNSSQDEDMKDEELEQAVTNDSLVVEPKKHRVSANLINCPKCSQRFRSRRTLTKHWRAHHAKKKPKSEQKEKSGLHSEAPMNPEDKFLCRQCGKGFAHQAFLKAHRKVHENAESSMPFACHLCPRRFGYKVAFAAHMKHHSSKLTCVCPVCEKSFQYKGSLVQHLKSAHAGERLCCKTCDRSFLRVSGFINHMDKHNVMTPFYCDICQIYLSQRGYSKHMLTHQQKVQESGPGESVEEMMEPLSEEDMDDSLDSSLVEEVETEKEALEKEELQQDDHEEQEKSE